MGYLSGASHDGSFLYIGWADVKVISAITTFFEVFYTNQCYQRYSHLYSSTTKLFNVAHHFLFENRLVLHHKDPDSSWIIHGWLVASTVLFFTDLQGGTTDIVLDKLEAGGLLRPAERQWLQGRPNDEERQLILLHWCSQVMISSTHKCHAPSNTAKSQCDKLLAYRSLQQEIVTTLQLPVPFQYFHILCVMISINLFFWAYVMGVTYSIFAPFVFSFAMLIFMGMMELASQLSDPFGEDEVDFPIKHWLGTFADHHHVMLDDECPHQHGWQEMVDDEVALRWDGSKVEAFMNDAEHVPLPQYRQELRPSPQAITEGEYQQLVEQGP